MRLLTVSQLEAGQRLDKLLGKYLNLAGKSFLYKMMRKKNIMLNDKRCDGSEKLQEGDTVKLYLAEDTIEKFSELKIQKVKRIMLDIIYEDDFILLINKPAGMLSQKAKDTDESLVEYLIDYLLTSGQMQEDGLRSFHPSVCNRLDRNTSGLVAAGKTVAGLSVLGDVFKDRSIHKYYQCIVVGQIKTKQLIRGYLKKDESTNQVMIYEQEVKDSVPISTEYEPVGGNSRYTLLKVTLITGRSHQIRAHLSSIGHAIVGDYKYGRPAVNEEVKKKYHITSQLLHSYQLILPELPQPLAYLSGRSFVAPLPEEFKRMIEGEQLWAHGIQED